MSPCLPPGIGSRRGVEAAEIGFSLLLLLMLTFQRIIFMLHSQNKSPLQCGQITVLHQILGTPSQQKPDRSALLGTAFLSFEDPPLPPLAALFRSPGLCQRGVFDRRWGQVIFPLWTMPLGSRCLVSPALPPCPHPGGFLSLPLCLASQISGLSGCLLGKSPDSVLLTTLTVALQMLMARSLPWSPLRIVTGARRGVESLEGIDKFLWGD